jgi:hypothetical protein
LHRDIQHLTETWESGRTSFNHGLGLEMVILPSRFWLGDRHSDDPHEIKPGLTLEAS